MVEFFNKSSRLGKLVITYRIIRTEQVAHKYYHSGLFIPHCMEGSIESPPEMRKEPICGGCSPYPIVLTDYAASAAAEYPVGSYFEYQLSYICYLSYV